MQENGEVASCSSDVNINFEKIAHEVGGLKGGRGADVRSVKVELCISNPFLLKCDKEENVTSAYLCFHHLCANCFDGILTLSCEQKWFKNASVRGPPKLLSDRISPHRSALHTQARIIHREGGSEGGDISLCQNEKQSRVKLIATLGVPTKPPRVTGASSSEQRERLLKIKRENERERRRLKILEKEKGKTFAAGQPTQRRGGHGSGENAISLVEGAANRREDLRGAKVLKEFPPHGVFEGVIEQIRRKKGARTQFVYHIVYEDGDTEDLPLPLVLPLLANRSDSEGGIGANESGESTGVCGKGGVKGEGAPRKALGEKASTKDVRSFQENT